MWVILIFLALGTALGFLLRKRPSVIQIAEKAGGPAVYLLLFLGVSVGENNAVMTAFGTLGLQAMLLTLGVVVGGVLMVLPVYRSLEREKTPL